MTIPISARAISLAATTFSVTNAGKPLFNGLYAVLSGRQLRTRHLLAAYKSSAA
jgi:hypothetical protein